QHPGAAGYCTLAVSPDQQTLVTAAADGVAWRWDLKTGTRVGSPLRHGSLVVNAAFSRDGRKLLTATRGGPVPRWDLPTVRATALRAHSIGVEAVALSPDGRLFATGTADGLVRLWLTESLRLVGPVHRHRSGVPALAFSPDGRLLAMGTERDGIDVV